MSLFFLMGIMTSLNANRHSDLLPLAHAREKVIIEGTVLQPTRIDEDIARFEVMAEYLFGSEFAIPLNEKIHVSIYNHIKSFSPGERIRFPARLRVFKNFNNPGRYNYVLAMQSRGFSCGASVSDGRRIVPMGKGYLGFPFELIENVRKPIRQLFKAHLPKESRAVLRGLILGERQEISPHIREPFNVTGVGHILAVSGLHIGMVAWLAFWIFKQILSHSYILTLKIDIRKLAALLTCLPVVAYTFIAGFQISSQRAMIMVLAYLFSIMLGREKEIWSTLAFAALLVLTLDPFALFSISFQLSFMAVVGIVWLAPTIHNLIPKPFDQLKRPLLTRIYQYITGLIVVTLSAVIFLAPITTFYFHRISIISIPANLTTVPFLGFWVIPFGLLSASFVHIAPSVATLFLQLAAYGLDWMMAMIRFWAQFDWAAFWVITPNRFEIILFYGFIFFIFFIKRGLWARVGLCLVLILLSADISYWIYKTRFNPNLKVTFIDVGQGNAALIQFPGNKRMLIDGGGFHKGTFDVGKMVVAPTLWYSKIKKIDYLVLSHPQSDHMNGLHFIASHFKPKEFWYNGEHVETPSFNSLMNILDTKEIKQLRPNDLFEGRVISGVSLQVLHPISKTNKSLFPSNSKDLNNHSLVLKLSYKGTSILFPGDLESEGEEIVVSNAGNKLKSHIMLAPHHGSRYSSSMAFLETVRPEICIISAGRGNSFGFPHPDTITRFEKMGCKILRIDKLGAIQISIGENHLITQTFLDSSGVSD